MLVTTMVRLLVQIAKLDSESSLAITDVLLIQAEHLLS